MMLILLKILIHISRQPFKNFYGNIKCTLFKKSKKAKKIHFYFNNKYIKNDHKK